MIYRFLLFCSIFYACSYSFTGASISSDISTFSVAQIQNNAPLVVPGLSETIGEKLRDKINAQTVLDFKRTDGDVQFEGSVTKYDSRAIALQGNQAAAQNRLTISMTVSFINTKNSEESWESTFTRFADFPGEQELQSVEQELIDEITNLLVQDIFNKAFVNW